VLQLLLHWQATELDLETSRTAWLNSIKNSNCTIGNFTKKCDRLALCRYLLTGELGEVEVGSSVMFAVPEEYGNKALDENFLQVRLA
jgi:hypothetical protein